MESHQVWKWLATTSGPAIPVGKRGNRGKKQPTGGNGNGTQLAKTVWQFLKRLHVE